MILIDQLRISDDGQKMYINVHVNTASVFDSIYLDNITIVPANKVMEATYCTPGDEFIYFQHIEGYGVNSDTKYLDLVIDKGVLDAAYLNWDAQMGQPANHSLPWASMSYDKNNFSSDLFFVYITCKNVGTPNVCFEELSCKAQELTTVGVTFDAKLLYQRVMGYTRELANSCDIPSQFIDFILNYNAFKASVETDHFCDAIRFYNQMFDMTGSSVTTRSKCGCHG